MTTPDYAANSLQRCAYPPCRLAIKALGADDHEMVEPEDAEDMDYVHDYTLRLLTHLLLHPPPREARVLAPTAAALRRRRAMLPDCPWPGAPELSGTERLSGEPGSLQHSGAAAELPGGGVSPQQRLVGLPCWALELHVGALPRLPAAWSDLALLPQLATLLLPGHTPRLPATALPHIASLTSLRALQLSVAGAAAVGGVGLLAAPGMGVSGGPPEELAARVESLSALQALAHLGLHANALPTGPLSSALGALTNLRDLFIGGAGGGGALARQGAAVCGCARQQKPTSQHAVAASASNPARLAPLATRAPVQAAWSLTLRRWRGQMA